MKRALVISGGGSKGAYAVGVVRQLRQLFPTLDYDIVVGTSTGSLIVPMVAIGELDLLEQIYTTQEEGTIVRKLRLGDRLATDSIFDANPLWELINQQFTDARYDALVASGKKIYINTTCLQTEELVVFNNDPAFAATDGYAVRSIVNANHFRRIIMASACQPVFMPTMQVNKDLPNNPEKNFQYVDGGVREYAGIEMAINAGATEIFTILLSTETAEVENKQYNDIFSLLERTIDIFTTDVGKNDLIVPGQYNEALKYIDAVKRKMIADGVSRDKVNSYFTIRGRESPFEDKVPLKLFTIRPSQPLGGGPGGLTFTSAGMRTMINTGIADSNSFRVGLKDSEITWV
ncbi:MAG TPA: patatin-like phospholipase family protein [Chitinophagaceae bacterium]|nr:patatin-like phospholipase family protein [Chitinophagaceae bacterium]